MTDQVSGGLNTGTMFSRHDLIQLGIVPLLHRILITFLGVSLVLVNVDLG
jgi:hypothetical protein